MGIVRGKKPIKYMSYDEGLLISAMITKNHSKLENKLHRITNQYILLVTKKKNQNSKNFGKVFRLSNKMTRLKTKLQRFEISQVKIQEGKYEKLNSFQKIRKEFSQMSYQKQKVVFGILFLLPWMIGFTLFFFIPMTTTFWWSLNKMTTKLGGGYDYIFYGINNYIDAFTTATLAETTIFEKLTVSVIDILLNLPTILIFSLLISVLLNTKFKGYQIVKAIFFIPVIYNMSVINNTLEGQFGTLFSFALDQRFVLSEQFSNFLLQIGIGKGLIEFLIGAVGRIFTVVNMSGIQIIIFIAALQSIPSHLYEAAKVEGATKFDMLCKITIPMVSPMVLPVVVYTIIDSFASSDIIRALTVNSQGTTMSTNNPGLFSAISIIYFLVNALIIIIVFAMTRKVVFYNDK